MVELLAYLQAKGFKTFIVSGAGQEFIRVFADKTYGVPPEQVVGSTCVTEFQVWQASPVLMTLPNVDCVDDGPGKPVGINKFIGRRPIFAFGNSDGDKEMLEWTAAGDGLRFMGLSIIPMRTANGPTIANPMWAVSTRRSMKQMRKVGLSST